LFGFHAEQELARLWIDAFSRQPVTEAAFRNEEDLARHPESVGVSREADLRIHFDSPMAVLYRVNAQDRVVEIAHVWSIA
jgi:hypothetical protein